MSRVSENSNSDALNFSVNKIKEKYEDLQLRGANLKKHLKTSDGPSTHTELIQIKTQKSEINQFKKNMNYCVNFLEVTENSLKELVEILNRTKEIAISQSSDFANPEIRRMVSEEIYQLESNLLGLSNRKMGNRYMFAGHKTLERPFDKDGQYFGDDGNIQIEIQKNFFIPINLSGKEIFFLQGPKKLLEQEFPSAQTLEKSSESPSSKNSPSSNPATPLLPPSSSSTSSLSSPPISSSLTSEKNVFHTLQGVREALNTNNSKQLQNTLDEIDQFHEQTIGLMAQIGSLQNTIQHSFNTLNDIEISQAARKSFLEDADVVELFSDLQKQDVLLKASYRAGAKMLNENLLTFLR
jgi:flagellar hook-associated protein 3 FlgL